MSKEWQAFCLFSYHSKGGLFRLEPIDLPVPEVLICLDVSETLSDEHYLRVVLSSGEYRLMMEREWRLSYISHKDGFGLVLVPPTESDCFLARFKSFLRAGPEMTEMMLQATGRSSSLDRTSRRVAEV